MTERTTDETCRTARLFSVTEANATLPLVRAITSDLVRLTRDVVDRHERLEHLMAGRESTAGDPYSDELSQIMEELEKDRLRLRDYVDELRELGIEPKSGSQGLVDFPTMIDGQHAYLCWQLGEPEILYWHSRESGFAGRQLLAGEAIAGSTHC